MQNLDAKRLLRLLAATPPFTVLLGAVDFGLWIAYVALVGILSALGEMLGGGIGNPFVFGWFGGLVATLLLVLTLHFSCAFRFWRFELPIVFALGRLVPKKWFPLQPDNVDEVEPVLARIFETARQAEHLSRLAKDTLGDIVKANGGLSAYLKFPGFTGLVALADLLLRAGSRAFSNVIFACAFTFREEQTVAGIRQGLALYAEDAHALVRRAFFAFSLSWGATFAIYIVLRGPVGGLFYLLPVSSQSWAAPASLGLALALRHCMIEPIALAALADDFHRTREGILPSPFRERQLALQSPAFRALGEFLLRHP